MKNFNPNNKVSSRDGIFGLPFNEEESKIVFLPVPWDVTTSYLAGTHKGPHCIRKASDQIDFFDLSFKDIYSHGLFMKSSPKEIYQLNKKLRPKAEKIIEADDVKIKKDKSLQKTLKEVNDGSVMVNNWVYQETSKILKKNKIAVVVGGDHSTPLGAIKAYSEKYPDLGILHVDAHSDTREAYIGFQYSHASIMYNVLEELPNIKKLVQVGIRDFCEAEFQYTKKNKKVSVYFDEVISSEKIKGVCFQKIAERIISELPQNIYFSFDIDGLDPKYCPNTGTPVPGGLEYHELVYLLKEIIRQKKHLVGFDLVEVAPGKSDWDANVAMRLLYKISGISLASLGICSLDSPL
jgi:agmatinase